MKNHPSTIREGYTAPIDKPYDCRHYYQVNLCNVINFFVLQET